MLKQCKEKQKKPAKTTTQFKGDFIEITRVREREREKASIKHREKHGRIMLINSIKEHKEREGEHCQHCFWRQFVVVVII